MSMISLQTLHDYWKRISDWIGTDAKPNVTIANAYDSVDDMMKIKSMQKKWRDSFTGSSLDSTKWDVIQTGTGHSIAVSNGELKISTGTTVSTETIIQSKEYFTLPCRAMFGLMLSQKIANQEFYVELVSVNPTTLQADGLNSASWKISGNDSLTNTNAIYMVQSGGATPLASSVVSIVNAQTSYGIYELEPFADECWFHTRQLDSSSGRSSSFVRHQQIPDPNCLFKVRIRAKNNGTAPASNTDLKLQYVLVNDYAELTAEITAGRGNITTGQAVGVQVINTVGSNSIFSSANVGLMTDTATNLGAGATYTGTTRDNGTSSTVQRFRAMIGHTAGLTHGHLVIEQSGDNVTWRESHRIPIPSDSSYRIFEFPILVRYIRVKFINGATAQTSFFLATTLNKVDGGFDFDKGVMFQHSATALASAGTFTGVSLNLGQSHSFTHHKILVYADQAGTLYSEQSKDGTTWRTTKTLAITANTATELVDDILLQYQRVRYVNGATANTVFDLNSILTKD